MTGAMRGVHRIQEVAGKLFLHELTVIREFSVRRDMDWDRPEFVAVMVMETKDRTPNIRVKLRFWDVRSLRIEFASSYEGICGFDVRDISDRQWDGIRWEVLDFENEVIHFYCRDAQVDDVEVLGSASS